MYWREFSQKHTDWVYRSDRVLLKASCSNIESRGFDPVGPALWGAIAYMGNDEYPTHFPTRWILRPGSQDLRSYEHYTHRTRTHLLWKTPLRTNSHVARDRVRRNKQKLKNCNGLTLISTSLFASTRQWAFSGVAVVLIGIIRPQSSLLPRCFSLKAIGLLFRTIHAPGSHPRENYALPERDVSY